MALLASTRGQPRFPSLLLMPPRTKSPAVNLHCHISLAVISRTGWLFQDNIPHAGVRPVKHVGILDARERDLPPLPDDCTDGTPFASSRMHTDSDPPQRRLRPTAARHTLLRPAQQAPPALADTPVRAALDARRLLPDIHAATLHRAPEAHTRHRLEPFRFPRPVRVAAQGHPGQAGAPQRASARGSVQLPAQRGAQDGEPAAARRARSRDHARHKPPRHGEAVHALGRAPPRSGRDGDRAPRAPRLGGRAAAHRLHDQRVQRVAG
ncbi:hypothetical protein B0H10DRAFT_318976 [Mycena sp. CBHHK59/15]|nr:hypothetical protein B0H10DRAFT_318976 [Mycena sp. CBHHK59/15]